MGYAEAIEQQSELLQWYQKPAAKASLSRMMNSVSAYNGTDHNEDMVRQNVLISLASGSPLWVASHIADLIASSEQSWPDNISLSFRDLPSPSGFCWFEKPLPLPLRDDGRDRPVSGFAWHTYAIWEGQQFVPLRTTGEHDQGVLLTIFLPTEPGYNPVFMAMLPFDFGKVPQPDGGEWDRIRYERLAKAIRYFQVLCGFVGQKVLVTSHRPIRNKSLRRRLTPLVGAEPAVRVVELRRREYQQHQESSDAAVEWHCRWMVRGHWRAQYFPSTGEHRPIWINPHVKGPDDKPLKTPRTIAYEVVR